MSDAPSRMAVRAARSYSISIRNHALRVACRGSGAGRKHAPGASNGHSLKKVSPVRSYYVLPLAMLFAGAPAFANNVGENAAWQFQTSADKVNKAYLEDLRQKKQNGYYAAPVYNTYIDRQYNCSVSSVATGNEGTNSTIANAPSTTGNSASAIGNDNQSWLDQAGESGPATVTDNQTNSGAIAADVDGDVRSNVEDNASWQVLNSDQQNSGAQTASVSASNACTFATLN